MTNSSSTNQESLRALPLGRILRFLLGVWLGFAVWPFFRSSEPNRILEAVFVIVGLVIFYSLLHWVVSSYLTRLNRWLGALLAFLPALLVFVLGGVPGQVGAATFVGFSLLLAAIRADPGCEVMSIPGLIFGRRTHLICILFSPIDLVEEKVFAVIGISGARS